MFVGGGGVPFFNFSDFPPLKDELKFTPPLQRGQVQTRWPQSWKHDFISQFCHHHKDVYLNSFFPCTARLWNYLPIECFPLIYDLNDFGLELTDTFNCRLFLNRFFVCFNLFVFLFLVTPCLAVAIQLCMEWFPTKKQKQVDGSVK